MNDEEITCIMHERDVAKAQLNALCLDIQRYTNEALDALNDFLPRFAVIRERLETVRAVVLKQQQTHKP